MSFRARAVAAIAVAVMWLPRVAAPIATTGCACAERGSPVIFDAATVERNPRVVVSGTACTARGVECQHRDKQDRCDTYWIVPDQAGKCLFSVQFTDATTGKETAIEDEIEYVNDTEYPCRGNVRPIHEHVTRINSL